MEARIHELCPVTEQRSLLVAYLGRIRPRIVSRAKRLCRIDARTNVLADAFAYEFLDVLLPSIEDDRWEAACDWLESTKADPDEAEFYKAIVMQMFDVLDNECDQALPAFAPLLGNLRVAFTALERIINSPGDESWRDMRDKVHDPKDVAIDMVMLSLDAKDIATAEHSRAVSSWSTRIARKMELSDGIVQKVTRGGLVHDLGKTTTPLEILQAPRRLSDDEWKIMANHVIAGWQMLTDLPALSEFSSIVRHHHEKYEGGGYPDNLATTDIPLSTRIVTVADCFNAMIGRRPYRVPLSPMGAIAELRRHRGKQFDPDVTDAMTELVYDMIEKGGLTVERTGAYHAPKGLVED